jgi:TonB-dependent Receptor Plug Domain
MKALTASLVVVSLGCGSTVQNTETLPTPPGAFLITAEQIRKSGAHTAWQVLKQSAPMLQTSEDPNGRPAKLGRRGRASFLLNEAPTVLLDGVRIPDFRALDDIDAPSISTIYIYDGIEGTTYYGTNSGSGVILIKTKAGAS